MKLLTIRKLVCNIYGVGKLDQGMIRVLGGVEQDDTNFHHVRDSERCII